MGCEVKQLRRLCGIAIGNSSRWTVSAKDWVHLQQQQQYPLTFEAAAASADLGSTSRPRAGHSFTSVTTTRALSSFSFFVCWQKEFMVTVKGNKGLGCSSFACRERCLCCWLHVHCCCCGRWLMMSQSTHRPPPPLIDQLLDWLWTEDKGHWAAAFLLCTNHHQPMCATRSNPLHLALLLAPLFMLKMMMLLTNRHCWFQKVVFYWLIFLSDCLLLFMLTFAYF